MWILKPKASNRNLILLPVMRFLEKVPLNNGYEYRVRHDTETQGANNVFTTKAQNGLYLVLPNFTVKTQMSIKIFKFGLDKL